MRRVPQRKLFLLFSCFFLNYFNSLYFKSEKSQQSLMCQSLAFCCGMEWCERWEKVIHKSLCKNLINRTWTLRGKTLNVIERDFSLLWKRIRPLGHVCRSQQVFGNDRNFLRHCKTPHPGHQDVGLMMTLQWDRTLIISSWSLYFHSRHNR